MVEKWRKTSGDPVNPSHYLIDGMDTFEYQEAIFTQYFSSESPCVFNISKYVLRSPLKNGIEDIKKAKWYHAKLIDGSYYMTSHSINVSRYCRESDMDYDMFIQKVANRYPPSQQKCVVSIFYNLGCGDMDSLGENLNRLIDLIINEKRQKNETINNNW